MADIDCGKIKENKGGIFSKINQGRKKFRQWRYRVHFGSYILKGLVWLSMLLTVAVLAFLILYILINGIPNLSLDLFALKSTSKNVSMFPPLINTFIITFLSLIIAVPVGIASAVYMVEYAKRGNKLVKVVRVATETLSGIPSIVFGLFGYLFFVLTLNWGYSLLAGVITMAIMVLPLIVRTTEEALIAVPDSYREGSFGLGAGKLRTVMKVVLPDALPGILSGVSLSIGRIVGETAALIYTAGTVANLPKNLFSSTGSLSVHMYVLLNEGLHMKEAYATAVILLLLVLFINGATKLIVSKMTKNKGE